MSATLHAAESPVLSEARRTRPVRPPVRNQYENFALLPTRTERNPADKDGVEDELILSCTSNFSACSTTEPDKIARLVIQAIRKKDVIKLQQFLSEYPMLHLYRHVDQTGASTLEWAVAVESTEILGMLIEKSPHSDERLDMIIHALNVSVTYNMVDLVKFLLAKKRVESHCMDSGKLYQMKNTWGRRRTVMGAMTQMGAGQFEDARFSSSVSPAILAAQLERHDILAILLEQGESDIHPVTVLCEQPKECTMYRCSNKAAGLFTIEDSHALLQKYHAISSPCFLLTTSSRDPINEAFQITVHLEALSREDPAFKNEYQEIAQKVRNFIWDFTSLCRTSQEIDALVYTETPDDESPCCVPQRGHNRIHTAVSLHQKEFLTHPHIQKFLQKAWYAGCPESLLQKKNCLTCTLFLPYILFYPLLTVLYLFSVSPSVNKLMNAPVLKFLAHVLSYLSFLVMLFIHATTHDTSVHNDSPSPLGILVSLWVFGMLMSYVKLLLLRTCIHKTVPCTNAAQVFHDWRVYDGFMLIIFLSATITYMLMILQKTIAIPPQVACCLYAIACLSGFLRTFTFMNESNILGPLYISLKRVALDTFKFGILIVIFMLAFVVARLHLDPNFHTKQAEVIPSVPPARSVMTETPANPLVPNFATTPGTHVLSRYKTGASDALGATSPPGRTTPSSTRDRPGTTSRKPSPNSRSSSPTLRRSTTKSYLTQRSSSTPGHQHTADELSERDLGSSLGSDNPVLLYLSCYFWMLFGYGEPNDGNVLCGDGEMMSTGGAVNDITVVQVISYTLLCLYMISVPLVLLNMLIAMMANSYTRIEVNSDSEWKLARSRLRMAYIYNIGVMPPPLNLIPLPFLINCVRLLLQKCQVLTEKPRRRDQHIDFQTLVTRLTKRYWGRSKEHMVISPPKPDDRPNRRSTKLGLQLDNI